MIMKNRPDQSPIGPAAAGTLRPSWQRRAGARRIVTGFIPQTRKRATLYGRALSSLLRREFGLPTCRRRVIMASAQPTGMVAAVQKVTSQSARPPSPAAWCATRPSADGRDQRGERSGAVRVSLHLHRVGPPSRVREVRACVPVSPHARWPRRPCAKPSSHARASGSPSR